MNATCTRVYYTRGSYLPPEYGEWLCVRIHTKYSDTLTI